MKRKGIASLPSVARNDGREIPSVIRNNSERPFWPTWVSIALIVIIGVMVYANALGGGFIYDDSRLVKNNVYIKQWSNLSKVFTSDIGSGAGSIYFHYNFYRPVQMLTYMVDYSLWGLTPFGYHLTSLLLHIAVAIALYFLVSIIFKSRAIAFFTSAIFTVHPLHTEAVSYIAGRADMLAGLFMLLFLIFYIKNLDFANPQFLIIAISSYILACLSKEYSLTVVLLVFLYHYAFRKKIKWSSMGAVLAVTLIYIFLKATVFNFPVVSKPSSGALFARLPGFFIAFGEYIRLLVLPFGLHMEYGSPLFKIYDPRVFAGIAALAAMIWVACKMRSKNDLIFFSIAWYILALLPVSNLLPINAFMSEHWLYVPSMGIFALAGYGLDYLYEKRGLKFIALAALSCIVLFYGALTVMQNGYWKDSITFYERTLKYSKDNGRIYSNLATEYMNEGQHEKAIEVYKKAVANMTDSAGAYNNLGIAYSNLGRNEEAISSYKKAIELNPVFAEAYNNLGVSYSNAGRKDLARHSYRKAIEINPAYADAYNNLGSDSEDPLEAIDAYRKAIEINPRQANAYYNLGRAYNAIGNTEEGMRMQNRARELDPNLE